MYYKLIQKTSPLEKMSPNRTGFTPLVVTSLVFGGIAIITHITAVAYPEWDGIDTTWHPVPNVSLYLPIQAHGSLWDFAVVIDRSNKFFHPIQKYTDTSYTRIIGIRLQFI